MTNKEVNNIAVFIDGDNISPSHYEILLNEIRKNGRIIVHRLYADFMSQNIKGWKDICVKFGIRGMQTFRLSKKESTDNELIVDCMSLLYGNSNVQTFVIVSSDSDFSSLANEIRLRGTFCIGMGYKHTPEKLRSHCDKFIVIENLVPTTNNKIITLEKRQDVAIRDFIINYFENNNLKHVALDELLLLLKTNIYIADIQRLKTYNFLKVYKGRVIYLIHNEKNILEESIKILDDSEYDEVFLCWLKDKLLNIDSSFDQRIFGYRSMVDFANLVIDGTQYKMKENRNNETVIYLDNSRSQ